MTTPMSRLAAFKANVMQLLPPWGSSPGSGKPDPELAAGRAKTKSEGGVVSCGTSKNLGGERALQASDDYQSMPNAPAARSGQPLGVPPPPLRLPSAAERPPPPSGQPPESLARAQPLRARPQLVGQLELMNHSITKALSREHASRVVLTDSAGVDHIQRYGPRCGGGAAKALYRYFGNQRPSGIPRSGEGSG